MKYHWENLTEEEEDAIVKVLKIGLKRSLERIQIVTERDDKRRKEETRKYDAKLWNRLRGKSIEYHTSLFDIMQITSSRQSAEELTKLLEKLERKENV